MSARPGVSWKWLAGILVSVVLLAGGGWVRYIQAELGQVKAEQQEERDQRQEQAGTLRVLREKIERVEEQAREIRQDQKEHNKKLDEILRRVR